MLREIERGEILGGFHCFVCVTVETDNARNLEMHLKGGDEYNSTAAEEWEELVMVWFDVSW